MKFINAEAVEIFSKVEQPKKLDEPFKKLSKENSSTSSSDEGIDSEHRKSYSSDETFSETESILVITDRPNVTYQPLTLLSSAPKPSLHLSKTNYSSIINASLSSDFTEITDVAAEMQRQKDLLTNFIETFKQDLDQGDIDSISKSLNEKEVTSLVASKNKVFHYTTRSGFNAYLWYHVKAIQARFPSTCRDSADWLKQACVNRTLPNNAKAYVLDFTHFFKKIDHSKVIEAIEFYGAKLKNKTCLVEAFKLWLGLSAIQVDDKYYIRNKEAKGIPLEHKISIQLMNLTLAYWKRFLKFEINT